MFAYHTACGAYRQNCCMTSGRIICPEKQWDRYSLEDLMTKYQWYFAPQKLKKEEKESMLQFCKRNPPPLWRPQVKQTAKNTHEKKKIFMSGK